jgi:hypothetical protein
MWVEITQIKNYTKNPRKKTMKIMRVKFCKIKIKIKINQKTTINF